MVLDELDFVQKRACSSVDDIARNKLPLSTQAAVRAVGYFCYHHLKGRVKSAFLVLDQASRGAQGAVVALVLVYTLSPYSNTK